MSLLAYEWNRGSHFRGEDDEKYELDELAKTRLVKGSVGANKWTLDESHQRVVRLKEALKKLQSYINAPTEDGAEEWLENSVEGAAELDNLEFWNAFL